MKNTDIAKIRQLLKQARKWIMEEGGVICPHKFGGCKHDNENCPIFCLDHALILLPCSTCNGTEIMWKLENGEFRAKSDTPKNMLGIEVPCPDCKPNPCKTCKSPMDCPHLKS